LLAGAALTLTVSARQAPAIRITSPPAGTVVVGSTRLEAVIEPQDAVPTVQAVTFTVDGRLACTVERPPFACAWDSGDAVRDHHVRVVATLAGGGMLKANLRTATLYAERVRTDAVLVPVIVTRAGRFVRGLKRQDFEIAEDMWAARRGMASEDGPGSRHRRQRHGVLARPGESCRSAWVEARPGEGHARRLQRQPVPRGRARDDQQARERRRYSGLGSTALYDATVAAW
jgi:hypothetical protein